MIMAWRVTPLAVRSVARTGLPWRDRPRAFGHGASLDTRCRRGGPHKTGGPVTEAWGRVRCGSSIKLHAGGLDAQTGGALAPALEAVVDRGRVIPQREEVGMDHAAARDPMRQHRQAPMATPVMSPTRTPPWSLLAEPYMRREPEVTPLNPCELWPDALVRIQRRGIRRPTLQGEAVRRTIREECLDDLAAMSGRSIPDGHHLARDLPQQMLPTGHDID